ncbi:aminoacyltransferase [Streptococcus anginosus]|uniref:Peptidoglycan branched peptide synthesis protein n=1 Tax=Streptococcus anginosus TaxID=1328 RepID=A0A448AI15_STRAP|nr:aminoacyltransferase [Streptococcus anginosus]GAD40237.1 defense mechanisms [Streptococcus intermedius SK54 = ATCC 27335]EGL46119.1 FemAB family protein [Streptococcus anginosus SK52 = DSM 20563]MBZ2156762.1 aminoacyltransferase [Streptococcus anginosus]ORE83298.1 UDP-N-acetylmuramoylpentapeptide-lysine N(6)-alanyltransferase [Streptococcus anginosus SK52 = DSM 20563]UEB02940.1 aminoacyltransferase [Streptococcus anginosus subsp. anginosus]
MYTYKIGISAQEHDDFVKASSQTNLLQSASWAKVKDNWDNERIGFYKNNQLVASASILIKPLPLSMTMLYIPRGPIMDYQDQELLHFVLTSLKKFAKTKKALFIKFDPSLFLVQAQIGEDKKEQQETLDVIQNLQKAGAIWVGRTESLDETIQPRFQANIYKDNFSEELLSKSTRQAIRTARNKGIQVQFGGKELLDDFSTLMKKTENRKSIHLRGKDYYQKLLDTYPEHSYITLASIDLNERLESLQAQKAKAEKEASKFTEKTKPGKIENNKQEQKRLQEEMDFLSEKIAQGVTTVPLSGTLVLEYGATSENIYAGMDEEYRRYQPALLTWYETAKHAFDRGANWQNMGGVENDLDGGLYHFKSKFNPTIEEFVGEFNLPTNPLYHLSNLAYTLRKKFRSKH